MASEWIIVGWGLSTALLILGYAIALAYYDDDGTEPENRRGRPVGEVPD